MLSSAYGLPVLGKRDEAGEILKGGDQFEAPNGYVLADVEGDSAIYRPKELDIRELTLTAIGGTIRHDTAFVPPAAARHINGRNLFDGLSIERWQHWAVLGRDVYTEVVYKGFLFPLGLRASLVKVTERIFLRNERNFIKAYLRQRLFIRCGKPEKRFPALRQPNGGRQFHCDLLVMLTINTPDIADPAAPSAAAGPKVDAGCEKIVNASRPTEYASGRLRIAGVPGLIFWPRTALTPEANVLFNIKIGGRATRAPLIFIDNTAAHERAAIKSLVDYYNEIASPDGDATAGNAVIEATKHLRTLPFGGQALRYCEELKAGDCTIKTDSWTIKAQGRRSGLSGGGEGENEDQFDAQLEGADQPPFYPAIATGRVRVKQVERFSGGVTRPAVVQFDSAYVEQGFTPIQKRGRRT